MKKKTLQQRVMEDPRDEETNRVVLTESSDDELKDLAKEYEAKARELMAKKEKNRLEREKKRSQTQIQRSRSPSPQGRKLRLTETNGKNDTYKQQNIAERSQDATEVACRKQKMPSTVFTTNLLSIMSQKKPTNDTDYSKKEFSFNNIPQAGEYKCDEKDPYSLQTLTKRYYTKEQLTHLFENIKPLVIDKLFAKVYPPAFKEPEYTNWMLVGMVLSKSEIKYTNDAKKSKYMKIVIGNFNLSTEVLLFGDAFSKYWKLRVGDVIAILNPKINPFRMSLATSNITNTIQNRQMHPRGFNLKLDDDADSIIEIGKSRDLGFCKSFKKDGTKCESPIDLSKTDVCNFHHELAIRKSSSHRMALNGSVSLKSPSKKDGTKKVMYYDRNNQKISTIGTDYSNYKPIQTNAEKLYFTGSSFFNDEYTNPKMLENLKEKRRKLHDKKGEKILLSKLSNIKSQASLSKLGLLKNNGIDEEFDERNAYESSTLQKKHKSISVAFNHKALDQIGFNPASNSLHVTNAGGDAISHESTTTSIQPVNEIDSRGILISELKNLSNKPKTLKKQILVKDKDQKNNLNKTYKEQVDNCTTVDKTNNLETKVKLDAGTWKKPLRSGKLHLTEEDSSDSDIEIQFNNDKDRSLYKDIVHGGD